MYYATRHYVILEANVFIGYKIKIINNVKRFVFARSRVPLLVLVDFSFLVLGLVLGST
jgi:hypothetical protein